MGTSRRLFAAPKVWIHNWGTCPSQLRAPGKPKGCSVFISVLESLLVLGWSGTTQVIAQLHSPLPCNIDTGFQVCEWHLKIWSVDIFWDGIIVWKLEQNIFGWLWVRATWKKKLLFFFSIMKIIKIVCVCFWDAYRQNDWGLSRTAVWQGDNMHSGMRWGLIPEKFGVGLSKWQLCTAK